MKRTDDIACPFYTQGRKNVIVCDCIRGGINLQLSFKSASDLAQHVRDKCKSIRGCQDCVIHKVIWEDWR